MLTPKTEATARFYTFLPTILYGTIRSCLVNEAEGSLPRLGGEREPMESARKAWKEPEAAASGDSLPRPCGERNAAGGFSGPA